MNEKTRELHRELGIENLPEWVDGFEQIIELADKDIIFRAGVCGAQELMIEEARRRLS